MKLLRSTRSVCPVCLRNLSAALEQDAAGRVFMKKCCPDHGEFRTLIWRGLRDFDAWRGHVPPLTQEEGTNCPGNCGACGAHPQGSCCVLLEVTRRCNLHCRFCFAEGGAPEPTLAELKAAADAILTHGRPLIQLSGGEPTLRDDLPALVRYIRAQGGRWVQLNTNGLRLAEDPAYARALAEAGLSIVFLQFDAVRDEVYGPLRGRPLRDVKYRAIEVCGRLGLGVTLVPTVVRGVNDDQIGEIVREGAFLSPAVRGVHFQPVSYFGRIPGLPEEDSRYTLDELISALETQAGLPPEALQPSRCDHPGCGLHAALRVTEELELLPMTPGTAACGGETTAAQNRAYIARRWSAAPAAAEETPEAGSLDEFLATVGRRSFTVTAMAFQDAGNLDAERLRRCSLHVYDGGRLLPFCARYLTPLE